MLKDLYNTQAHFGHQKRFRTPQLKSFLYGCYNGIDIINLDKTVEQIERIAHYLKDNLHKKVLIISSRRLEFVNDNIEQLEKWKPGYISNFKSGKLKSLPEIIIVDKVAYNANLVNEARKANIDIIAFCDTNTSNDIFQKVNYPIVVNDDSDKAIDLILNKILG